MTLTVEPGDPHDPAATALLRSSHALMESLFPAESNHYLDVSALAAPDIRFFVARLAGAIVGTGALAIRDGYGEVKSMFVGEVARGTGAGAAILDKLEETARAEGLPAIKLETGTLLHAAHRLYERGGFTQCGPFGDYEPGEFSLFFEKRLA